MKKLSITVLLFLSFFFFLRSTANAQASFEPGQLGINAGISYGTDLKEPGIRAGLTYFIAERARIGADITYWVIEDKWVMEEEISSTGLEFNANLHFLFARGRNLVFYAIGAGGLHYTSVSGQIPELDTSDAEFGIGFGAGAEFNIGFLSFFAEPKLFFSGFDQLKLNGGVRLYF